MDTLKTLARLFSSLFKIGVLASIAFGCTSFVSFYTKDIASFGVGAMMKGWEAFKNLFSRNEEYEEYAQAA